MAAMKTTAGNEINTVNVGLGSNFDSHCLIKLILNFIILRLKL
jgi:hypothetical protein